MWCLLLENVLALKHRFENDFGEAALWQYDGLFKNCIEYWSSKYEYYQEMFYPLIVEQFGDFLLFRYNILETKKGFWEKYDGMYRECRSIVIDIKNECVVLAPFSKFFNLNETDETQEKIIRKRIQSANYVTVTDKLDGSMQSARYYNGHIILSGTRNMDPSVSKRVEIGYQLLTDNYKKMLVENPQETFIFELIHPYDKHIVDYDASMIGLHLIGVRNVTTGYQYSYIEVVEFAQKYHIKHVTISQLTFDDLMEKLDDKNCNEAEGFVVDIDGYKIKVKYNDYVKLHKVLLKTLSTNTIIQSVNDNSWDDLYSKIPDIYKEESEIVVNNVKLFVKKKHEIVVKIYKDCCSKYTKDPSNLREDKKNFISFIMQNHKKEFSYLLNMYENNKNNYLVSKSGRQIKYKDILEWLSKN